MWIIIHHEGTKTKRAQSLKKFSVISEYFILCVLRELCGYLIIIDGELRCRMSSRIQSRKYKTASGPEDNVLQKLLTKIYKQIKGI
jgi:hypothetical protein